jgi:hypothetical protein
VFWYIAVLVEAIVCAWVHVERRILRRRATAPSRQAIPPLHRAYGRALGRIGRSGRQRHLDPPLERREARRRTGLVTFGLTTAAMAPMLLLVVVDGWRMNPVLGQLVAWSVLWLAPVLTVAPARLVALLVAVWRGWLRLDSDGGSANPDVPAPRGPGPGSHEYWLAR